MLIVGGYTERMNENTPGKARGISVYDFFPREGRIQFLAFTPAINPSYVITDRKRKLIYAVREKTAAQGAGVTVHRLKRDNRNKLSFELLSDVPLPGDNPCHLSFAGNTLLVSSYDSGHLHVLRREDDGSLSEVLQNIPLTCDKATRESHAHCAVFVEARNQVLVCDLGADRLNVFDRGTDGRLTERPELALAFPDGEGPRHIALHPAGELAVVNGELVGRVHLIDLSGEKPLRATVANALPERVVAEAHGAAIRIGKNGKMVYVSDRAFSVVTVLRIDERGKKLVVRDTYPSGGDAPRDLNVSPDGDWLLTANSNDSTLGVFKIDGRGGLVHYHTFNKIPTPTALAWL